MPNGECDYRGYPPIEEYAIIGDCRSAALISRGGSLDWLCLPRFDSPSIFAALLDRDRGGRFVIRPTGEFTAERRYIDDTNALETTFRTSSGVARLVDLMPVASEADKAREFRPDHEIIRAIECVDGEVEIEAICDPRPDYARCDATVVDRGSLGCFFEHGSQALILRSELPLGPISGCPGLCGRRTLRAGERTRVSLSFSVEAPAVIPSLGAEADAKIEQSIAWWRRWSSQCRYQGPHRHAVVRSALTLKLMTFAPSGAVVAAPTTSLPEWIGGVRNWDYRYCWLRDASMTLRALFDLGYPREGESFLSWMMHATRLTWPGLSVLYNVYGEAKLPERDLEYLTGYAGSRPVRIGNAADDQLQLDTYGEVVDAAYEFAHRGGRLDRVTARMLVGLGRTVCKRWREPDEGVWEIRAGRRQHTFSKAMCWVALDRLVKLHEQGLLKTPIERFAAEREKIREEIERRGYNETLGSYVSEFEGEHVDASLLLLGIYGYADPKSPRMRSTCSTVHKRLGRDELLYRYHTEDGLPGGEGAFGICSFWGVECAAMGGQIDAAIEMFDKLCARSNDVGLYAEEIDPETGCALGNFPQAFTHVGLINAALTLTDPVGERRVRLAESPTEPLGKSA